MENISNIYIALTLGGIVVGMVIIISLLKIIGSIFSAMFGGRQYIDDREGREGRRRSMGCLIPFLLLISLFAFGTKSLRDSNLFKLNILTVPNESIEKLKPEVSPPPATYLLDDDEIAFEDDPLPQTTPKGEISDTDKSNTPCTYPHAIQDNFFKDHDNAKKRMAELFEEFGDVGLYIKEKDGSDGYAVVVYGFCSQSEAEETKNMHGLLGTVMPSEDLDILRYEGN